ncbi:MAG: hypothetical protein ACXWZR_11060 [Mycobacterium sp.]
MITADHLQRLLAAEQKNATLVPVEGRIDVIGPGQLASTEYRGALEVVSREDLVKRLGEAPPNTMSPSGPECSTQRYRSSAPKRRQASISPAILRSMAARVTAGSTINPSSSFWARA